MAERTSKGRSSAEQWLRDIPGWALLEGFGVVVEVSLGTGVQQVMMFVVFLIWVEVVICVRCEAELGWRMLFVFGVPDFRLEEVRGAFPGGAAWRMPRGAVDVRSGVAARRRQRRAYFDWEVFGKISRWRLDDVDWLLVKAFTI